MDRVQKNDCIALGNSSFIDWEKYKNTTILITGATGLIGSNLVNALAYNSREKELSINLILPVRNVAAAKKEFDWTGAKIIPYDICSDLNLQDHCDYIVHLASPTGSQFFAEKPVDTMVNIFEGYKALLDWSVSNPVKKFVGLSTMEVYGFPEKGHIVTEDEMGAFGTMNARNSYPISKIACEELCYSYYSQYHVPTVILRATQTLGPGIKYNDGRVFAQFMRCVIENKDIVLKSLGLTERSYLYTADAVSAILVSLIKAVPGQSYTIANPETYCSIKEMAEMVANEIADGKIKVVFDLADDIEKMGYAKTLFMDLCIDKISKIGWTPSVGLKDMYLSMIDSVKGVH